MQKFDNDIGCLENRHFFRRKLLKIAENCDHYIDPRFKMAEIGIRIYQSSDFDSVRKIYFDGCSEMVANTYKMIFKVELGFT
jgi:hypothetical protein